MNPDVLLSRLSGVRRTRLGWKAKCPVHQDDSPSLTILIGHKRYIVKCMAGCHFQDVLRAVGLGEVSLCHHGHIKEYKVSASTKDERKIVAQYDYLDERGEFVYQVVRFEPKGFAVRHQENNIWRWGFADERRVLYHLDEIVSQPTRHVIICEGEKDADRLRDLGLLATTNALGAGTGKKWHPAYIEALRGREVSVIADNDRPGLEYAQGICAALSGVSASVRMILLPHLEEKEDVSDWLDKRGGTKAELIKLCKQTAPYSAFVNAAEPTETPTEQQSRRDQIAEIIAGMPDDEPIGDRFGDIHEPYKSLTVQAVMDLLSGSASTLTPAEWVIYARGRISDLETALDFALSQQQLQ